MVDQLEKLELERKGVLQELEELRESLKFENSPDALDVANEMTVIETVSRLIRGQERKLREIEDAIEQLEYGKYGICEQCGQQIDPERLAIVPEAKFCVPCKTQAERLYRGARYSAGFSTIQSE